MHRAAGEILHSTLTTAPLNFPLTSARIGARIGALTPPPDFAMQVRAEAERAAIAAGQRPPRADSDEDDDEGRTEAPSTPLCIAIGPMARNW